MGIYRVSVEKDRNLYVCQSGGTYWLCGYCLKGKLPPYPTTEDNCPECSAEVVDVIADNPDLHRVIRSCAMCHEELREYEKLEDHYKLSCMKSIVPSFETRLRAIEEKLGL